MAAQKALDSARPREIPAGKYTVILEPAAVLDIVGFMFWDYSGMAILDQRSFLTGTNWYEIVRRQHYDLGRRCASSADRISI